MSIVRLIQALRRQIVRPLLVDTVKLDRTDSTVVAPIVSDSFNRGDNALTLGNADTGQAWSALSGTWGIESNTARLQTVVGVDLAVIDAGVANCTVSVLLATTSNNAHLVLRCVDKDNFLRVLTSGGNVFIQEYVAAGGFNTLNSAAMAVSGGDTLSVSLAGNVITAYLNGAQVVQTTAATFNTATKHGIGEATTTARYDNFTVSV